MGEWCFFIFNLVFVLRWQTAPVCTMQWFLPLTQVERAEWRHEAAVLLFIGTLTLFRPKTVSRRSSGPARWGAKALSQGGEKRLPPPPSPTPALRRPLASTALSYLGLINPKPVFDPTKQDCGYLGGWACHVACRQTAARPGRAGSLVTRTEVLYRVSPRASPARASDGAPRGQLIIVLRDSKSSLPVLWEVRRGGGE